MVDRGFASDAAFFDVVADQAKSPVDQKELREVADAYRALASSADIQQPHSMSRADHWRERAERCRALSNQFKSPICREQLLRLADTYEQMASCQEDVAPSG